MTTLYSSTAVSQTDLKYVIHNADLGSSLCIHSVGMSAFSLAATATDLCFKLKGQKRCVKSIRGFLGFWLMPNKVAGAISRLHIVRFFGGGFKTIPHLLKMFSRMLFGSLRNVLWTMKPHLTFPSACV